MNLVPVKGNTFYLEGEELIPLYRLEGGACILLDTGLRTERDALTAALEEYGLRPAGVLCSHAHRDHAANNLYLRERYGARVCYSQGEAALASSVAMYKASYDTYSPAMIRREHGDMLGPADETVGAEDGPFSFCGAEFQVVHTPGHTPDHISTVTPDGVCYVADALLSPAVMAASRLPFHLLWGQAFASMEKLLDLSCGAYLLAHRSVEPDLAPVVAANQTHLARVLRTVRDLAVEPMTLDQLTAAYLAAQKLLTRKEDKAARFSRGVRTMVEYLLDQGELTLTVKDGMRYYRRK